RDSGAVGLPVAGRQPATGQETVEVVRECMRQRGGVGCALVVACAAGRTTVAQPGPAGGCARGQTGAGLEVSPAGRLRPGQCRRVWGRAAPLLPPALAAC